MPTEEAARRLRERTAFEELLRAEDELDPVADQMWLDYVESQPGFQAYAAEEEERLAREREELEAEEAE